jgi:uridine phosphorylase
MSHLARGLWGYTGETEGGRRLTVQSTGVGGPSAAIVVAGLADLGVSRVVRLGTCFSEEADPGEAFVVTGAVQRDGTSLAITGSRKPVGPDPGLCAALESVAPPARAVSHDLPPRLHRAVPGADPAPLRDLQTAATFAVAESLGLRAAAILVVAETGTGQRLAEPDLEAVFVPLARSVAAVLERD